MLASMTNNNYSSELRAASDRFFHDLLVMKHGERILIYRDASGALDLSEALQASAIEIGVAVEFLDLVREDSIEICAERIHCAITKGDFDAICELSEQYFYQTNAWTLARSKRVPAYSLAGIDADSFLRCVGRVDQKKMFEFGQYLAGVIKSGMKVEIMSNAGTMITCDMHAPWFYRFLPIWPSKPRASISSPSGYLNTPSGSTFMGGQLAFQPIRKSINGTAVIDAYLWPPDEIGEFDSGSVILTLVRGEVTRIEGCERKAGIVKRWFGLKHIPIKHFCLGFNPGARLSGKILEAERAYGTISIGVGDYPLHTDGIIKKPTIIIDGKCLMKDGSFANIESNDLLKHRTNIEQNEM